MFEGFFEHVEFEPLRGTKVRHRWLSWNHFVRDVAWFARAPKNPACDMDLKTLELLMQTT